MTGRPTTASAAGGAGGGGRERADTRHVNTKTFQADSINAIMDFFRLTNYRAGPISAKILASPTGKDFANIITHLCQVLDPTFTLSAKIEDEVQALYKALRYPFTLSKTALSAVGSATSYPAILGALVWLVDLLTYEMQCRAEEEDGVAGDAAFVWSYMRDTYSAFLAGDDDRVDELDANLEAAQGACATVCGRRRGARCECTPTCHRRGAPPGDRGGDRGHPEGQRGPASGAGAAARAGGAVFQAGASDYSVM